MEGNGKDVIDIAVARRDRDPNATSLRVPVRPLPTCWHDLIWVHEDRPVVECRQCGAPLDPHRVLLQAAHRERNLAYACEKLRAEIAELHEERDGLRREVQNLKAVRKRAQSR